MGSTTFAYDKPFKQVCVSVCVCVCVSVCYTYSEQ